jgi:HD-GYP domain-containing protein (c-di-GMP phosphodiesterase class II)
MTTERPYRSAREPENAVEQLVGGAGSRFDPEVVDALASVLGVMPAESGAAVVTA